MLFVMTTSPFMNALYAIAYIAGVVALIFYGPGFIGIPSGFAFALAFLALFVLSAAVMILLFFYRPFLLFAAGKKEEAATFFARTLAAFAGMTIVICATLLAGASQSRFAQPISTVPPTPSLYEPVPMPARLGTAMRFDDQMRYCEAVPNGSERTVRDTSRMFVHLPLAYFPDADANTRGWRTISGNATAGYVSNGGRCSDNDIAQGCWSCYFQFEGGGVVEYVATSSDRGVPPYRFRVTVEPAS